MNWTEITQNENSPIWYVAAVNFSTELTERFVGFAMGQPLKHIIFSGSELSVGFFAVAQHQPVISATLYEAKTWFAETGPVAERIDLRTRFSDIPHAERSGFSFAINLNATRQDYLFDIYLNCGADSVWFASFHLVQRKPEQLQAQDLSLPNQLSFLRVLVTKKGTADQIVAICAQLIHLCGDSTPPLVFAILGDTLETQALIEPAVAAYRKAVELQPQESKYEMRLSQLLAKRASSAGTGTAALKGISLSTAGDTALTIIVDMLYRSTPSYMYARELFQNEMDAIHRRWEKELEATGQSDFTGTIRIQPDEKNPKKICFWGDGIGMTFEQVTNHLARLVNSGNLSHNPSAPGESSGPGNFGIGAKTSALPENTEGMVYKTLPLGESEGIEFVMWKNPDTFLYEIKGWHQDNEVRHFRRVPIEEFNHNIRQRGSGALATLLGNSPDEDTFEKSQHLLTRESLGKKQRRGIVHFLNGRYFVIPKSGLDIQVAEHDSNGALHWYPIVGQKALLERYAEQQGELLVQVGGLQATAYWWILSEEAKQQIELFNSMGHVGLLWKNELYYNPNESQRGQRLQLNGFGIHFGEERVVIYIELTQSEQVDSHPSRTKLMFKRRELNPTEFGEIFALNMPPELEAYQKKFLSSATTGESIEKIKENLRALGVHQNEKMRQYAWAHFNRHRRKQAGQDIVRPKSESPQEFRFHIPNCTWRAFEPEAALFAAEWDRQGYVVKFNSEWPQYQKTLALLAENAKADYPDVPPALLLGECENLLRFEYFKIAVETVFNSYAMVSYSDWTERMIEVQLLCPAGLSVVLQISSSLQANIRTALADVFMGRPELPQSVSGGD